MLFNKDGLIKNYTTPEEVVAEFYALRLHFYELRRQAQLKVSACLQTAHGWPWRVSAPASPLRSACAHCRAYLP